MKHADVSLSGVVQPTSAIPTATTQPASKAKSRRRHGSAAEPQGDGAGGASAELAALKNKSTALYQLCVDHVLRTLPTDGVSTKPATSSADGKAAAMEP